MIPFLKAQLDQDHKAIETINALSFRDVERAKTKAASLPDSKLNLVSSKIAKSSVEISEKNYGSAINNLRSLQLYHKSRSSRSIYKASKRLYGGKEI